MFLSQYTYSLATNSLLQLTVRRDWMSKMDKGKCCYREYIQGIFRFVGIGRRVLLSFPFKHRLHIPLYGNEIIYDISVTFSMTLFMTFFIGTIFHEHSSLWDKHSRLAWIQQLTRISHMLSVHACPLLVPQLVH